MIIQLEPMLPLYVPKFDIEGYAFALETRGQENYIYFHMILDNGEIWSLDNTQVRGCINYTAGRPTINKEPKSEFIKTK